MTEQEVDLRPAIDGLVRTTLEAFAESSLQHPWYAKEHNWVNLFAFTHLVRACRTGTPLYDPGQIAIEVGVPQPPGYAKAATRRDVVIWKRPGTSCWNTEGEACYHPLAILEWKVHRPGRRNREVSKEREWLRRYTIWQPTVLCYAVELDAGTEHRSLAVARYFAGREEVNWLASQCLG